MNRHERRRAHKKSIAELRAIKIDHEAPVEQCHVEGALRVTVITPEGEGATIYLQLDEYPQAIADIDRAVNGDVDRARRLILYSLKDAKTAGMLALYCAWHHPDGDVAKQICTTIEQHGQACVTLGLDKSTNTAVFAVAAEYASPFPLARHMAKAGVTKISTWDPTVQ